MVTVGLWVRLEAKPGKEEEVAQFLKRAAPLAEAEPDTTAWFALRIGPSTFGIFDVFPDDRGRQAHLSGLIAKGLTARGPELLSNASMEPIDLLASKLKT